MVALFAIVALSLLLPTIAHADVSSELARCAAKEGDLERLSCYDEVAANHGLSRPQFKPTSISDKGKWQVSVSTNPIDDSQTIRLALRADSGESWLGEPVVLIARCKSNTTELYIIWHAYLGNPAHVITRIGSRHAVTKEWSLSNDNTATFHQRGTISFIKKMMAANKLVAQVTPYDQSPVTAIFATAGLENAIKPLRKTCNW